MYQPPIPDKAGRGAICARIDVLVKEVLNASPKGRKPDKDKLPRLTALLDLERKKLHKLYNHKERPCD